MSLAQRAVVLPEGMGDADNEIHIRLKAELEGFFLDVGLTLPGKGVTAIFGHSGSGKTTLLRCIAGLQTSEGRLSVKGSLWQDDERFIPVHGRSLAYVFQEASLFPHLSVRKNLEYGYRRVPTGERRIEFDDAVEWLGLDGMLDRMPHNLSGGERQRVAIARAILTSPQLLLMDEPLSALDHASKKQILPYLERLHEKLSIPVIYVTHSPDEVARLADHLVVMEKGCVIASGAVSEVLSRLDLPIRLGGEVGVVLEAVIQERDERWNLVRAQFNDGSLWIPGSNVESKSSVRLRILARDVSLALQRHDDQSILNLLPAHVVEVVENDTPGISLVKVEVGNTPIIARLTALSVHSLNLVPDKLVWVQVKSVAVLD